MSYVASASPARALVRFVGGYTYTWVRENALEAGVSLAQVKSSMEMDGWEQVSVHKHPGGVLWALTNGERHCLCEVRIEAGEHQPGWVKITEDNMALLDAESRKR